MRIEAPCDRRGGNTASLRSSRHRRSDVIHLELTENEASTLVKVLDYYVSELRMEVTDTEQKDLRDALKVEEDTLKRLVQILKQKLAKT
jgi:hypothetical protein